MPSSASNKARDEPHTDSSATDRRAKGSVVSSSQRREDGATSTAKDQNGHSPAVQSASGSKATSPQQTPMSTSTSFPHVAKSENKADHPVPSQPSSVIVGAAGDVAKTPPPLKAKAWPQSTTEHGAAPTADSHARPHSGEPRAATVPSEAAADTTASRRGSKLSNRESFVEPQQIQLSQVAMLEQMRRQRQQEQVNKTDSETTRAPRAQLQATTVPVMAPPPLKRTRALTRDGEGAASNAQDDARQTPHFGSNTKTSPRVSVAPVSSSSAASVSKADIAPSTQPARPAMVPMKLSKRASVNTQRVNEAIQRCVYATSEDPPTPEQQELFAMVRVVRLSPIGLLFVSHPEVILSNRAAVIIARNLVEGDEAGPYCVTRVLKPGTLGRSYQASTMTMLESPTSKSSGLPDTFDERRLGGFGVAKSPLDVVLKVVSCVLRRASVPKLMSDVRKLINLTSDHVARVTDVLRDDHYNVIVCSQYHRSGNIVQYAGKMTTADDVRIMKDIMLDIAIGLHDLHSVKIAHHNVRLENILRKDNGQYCLSDAGFSALFATESPEALLFNGELAALPPEVFDPNGMYANDEWEGEAFPHLEKVDVWGFGVFMYQLAYGTSPIVISELSSMDAHHKIVTAAPELPERPDWPFAAAMNNAISLCLEKQPQKRPAMFELLSTHEFFASDFAQRRRASARQQSDGPSSAGPAQQLRTPVSISLNVGTNIITRTSSTSSAASGSQQNLVGYTVDAIVSQTAEAETLRVHLRADPSKEFAFKVALRSLQARFKTVHLPAAVRRQLAFSRKVKHPHLVPNIELIDGEVSGLFIVQEFLSGGPLSDLPPLTKPRGSEGPTMQTLLAEVLLALVHLHDNDVPHLSLAPSNIFYTQDKKHFKIVDYGALCRSVEEMIDPVTKRPCFDIPDRITQRVPMRGTEIDIFTFGLLAASALPELFHSVWGAYRRVAPGKEPLSVEHVLRTLAKNTSSLPSDLIDLATVALTKPVSARDLLKHPYMVPVVPKEVAILTVSLSQTELEEAVKLNSETQVENRLMTALGYDPLQESITASTYSADNLDLCEDTKATIVLIKGRKVKCAKCKAEMMLSLYLCLSCRYICCGKCAIDNDHMPGHQLDVFIMYKVKHPTMETMEVTLIHPAAIKKVHALENLEARDNLPAGTLTKRYNAARAMERSMRSFAPAQLANNSNNAFQGVVELQSEAESDVGSESTNLFTSTVSSCVNGSHNGAGGLTRASNNFTRLKSLNSVSAFGVQLGTSLDGMSPVSTGLVPSAPPKNSLMMMVKNAKQTQGSSSSNISNGGGSSAGKKLMLAKEADIDDESPEEELEKCRANRSHELLLFNFALTAVPREVYDPPLTHLEVLDLKENLLTSLPDELSFLKFLRKLTVSYNQLTELPRALYNLTFLEEIDASHNQLTSLPDTFVCLSRLNSIALDYNNFTEVPACILNIYGNDSPEISYGALPPGNSAIIQSVKPAALAPPGSSPGPQMFGSGTELHSRHVSESMHGSPCLNAIYMVANDNLTTFPSPDALRRFPSLQLCLDNEPSLYKFYYSNNLETQLPNVTVNWNKNYPDEIIPQLYCGSLRTTQSQKVYAKLNIEYVLTVGRGLQPMKPEGGHQKTVIVDDIPGADIRCSFEESVTFIDESQRRGKGCLVHCFAGLSRSATTVIAYLMMRKGMRLDEAYLLTKKGRPAILPNAGFFAQLLKLDAELFPDATRPVDIESLGRPE